MRIYSSLLSLVSSLILFTGSLAQAQGINGGQPTFWLGEWTLHQNGIQREPYQLQNQIYHIEIDVEAPVNAESKTDAVIMIFSQDWQMLHWTKAQVKHRGSSSLSFPKKQYKIDLVDEQGEARKASLLGLAHADEWVLSAPYNDKTLLRDVLSYNLANSMGRYAPRTRILSASMRIAGGPIQNMGIHVLTEKSEIAPDKIDIPKKSGEQTAYLLQIDRVKDGDHFVRTQSGVQVIVDFPKAKNMTAEHDAQILAHLNDIEQRIQSPGSPGWLRLFEERVDLNAAIDFFISQEIARNVDGYRLSSPMSIPAHGKLHFGPIWDFNLAYGNADYENGWLYEGWRAAENGVWFADIARHPTFCAQLRTRWHDLRWGAGSQLSNQSIFRTIDAHGQIMAPRIAENFAIWGNPGFYVWPNAYWLPSYDEEVQALKSWIALRTRWMDQTIATPSCGF